MNGCRTGRADAELGNSICTDSAPEQGLARYYGQELFCRRRVLEEQMRNWNRRSICAVLRDFVT